MYLFFTKKQAENFRIALGLKEYPSHWIIIADQIPLTKVDVKEVEARLNRQPHVID